MLIETKVKLTDKDIEAIVIESLQKSNRIPIKGTFSFKTRTKMDNDGYSSVYFDGAEVYIETKQ